MIFGLSLLIFGMLICVSGIAQEMFENMKINRYVCLMMLGVITLLFFFGSIAFNNVKFNFAYIGIIIFALYLFFHIKGIKSKTYSIVLVIGIGVVTWLIQQYIMLAIFGNVLDVHIIRAILCTALCLIVASDIKQACFTCIFGYVLASLIYFVYTQDLELALWTFGIASDFTGICISLFGSLAFYSLLHRGKKAKRKTIEISSYNTKKAAL